MKEKKAFTLIELLVVIAIIALLLSIVMPALRSAKKSAQKTVCMQNLKSISLANALYAVEQDGRDVCWEGDPGIIDAVGPGAPWCTNPTFIAILAQNNDENQLTNRNPLDVYQFPKKFRCPGALKLWDDMDMYSESYIATTYAGNYSSLIFGEIDTTYVKEENLKSPSSKIMFLDSADMCMHVERADYVRYWDRWGEIYDNSKTYGCLSPAYRHNEGANGGFADGHVEYRPKEKLFYYIDGVEQSGNGNWGMNRHMWSFDDSQVEAPW